MEKSMQPATIGPARGFRLATLTALIALASPITLAQDAPWYAGFALGESRTGFQADELVSRLNTNGSYTTSITQRDSEFAGKLFAGYSFNRIFALEGSYYHLGEFGLRANTVPTATAYGETTVQGMGFDLVGRVPLFGGLSAIGRAGFHYAFLEESFRSNNLSFGSDDKDFSEKFGLGLQYDFSDSFAMRLEKERYNLDETSVIRNNADLVTLGFVFRFGARPAPAPAPVAAAPQPAPAPAPPAPPPAAPPAPVRITLSADALFDFNSAELRPAGRQELDVLMEDLRGLDYEVINITGHTDRLGTRQYNLPLSQRRADTVRNYMIGSGIPAGDITARGVNGDNPVTTAQQCTGPVNAALIACLQPDRRVEVEVTGLRVPE
jgi:OmpA-OmpF porin, OOP family